ncbi:MAG: DUF11 domain-containing protein [Candidatus Nanopelagicales bacterium]
MMRVLRGFGRFVAAMVAAVMILPGIAVASAVDQFNINIELATVPANVTTFDTVGQVITFRITATNSGQFNLTRAGLANSDPDVTFSAGCPSHDNPKAEFPVGDSFTCTATYRIKQSDIDRGNLYQAQFEAFGWNGVRNEVRTTTPVLTAVQTPAVDLRKTVTSGSPYSKPGDKITYRLVATNTGNVTLTNVQITDPKLGQLDVPCSPALGSSLAPGATMTCTGSYTVTQADVDAGVVDNTAFTKGTPPKGADVTDTDSQTVPGDVRPAIDIVKRADPQTYTQVGQVINYTLVATNTGNVTLRDVVVTDPKLANLTCNPAIPAVLRPAEKTTCTGLYTITQADVESGRVTNIARATGQPPGNKPPVTDEDTAVVTGPDADLGITKSHTPASVRVGEEVTFTLTVTNNGPGTSYGVSVKDTLPAELEYVSAGGPGWTCQHANQVITCDLAQPLAPRASSVITVVVKTVAASGQIVNVAVVDATSKDPNPANNRAEDVVGVTKEARTCPTGVTRIPGVAVIQGCRDVQVRALCKISRPKAAGQLSYCRVKVRKNGSFRVISKSQYPVKVKVVWFAPATDEYHAFRKVKRFTLKPNQPKV